MARIPLIEGDASPAVAALRTDILARGRDWSNLYRVLANHPPALAAFMQTSAHVRDESILPPRVRELAILATGLAVGCDYEVHHHQVPAQRAGVTEAELAQLPAWRDSGQFSAAERSAMAYAEEIAQSRRASVSTFQRLREHFDSAAIAELTLTLGWYHLVAAFLLALDVELEEPTADSAAGDTSTPPGTLLEKGA